jgi:prevent-host-death family protein
MTAANVLLKARNVGVRKFRNRASRFVKSHRILVITEHGKPTAVLMPYSDMLDIVDTLDELRDKNAIETIAEGRKAIASGAKGISVSKVFKRIKKRKKK